MHEATFVGWALETHLQASLAIAALKMALVVRHPRHSSLVHHSDRGIQYACGSYTELLKAHGIVASMSRIGNPHDNAKVESFIKTLKQEAIDGRSYRDLRYARRHIDSFIKQAYNRHRLRRSTIDRPWSLRWVTQRRPSPSPPVWFSRHGKSTAMNKG
jgi:transposase InsO family protein